MLDEILRKYVVLEIPFESEEDVFEYYILNKYCGKDCGIKFLIYKNDKIRFEREKEYVIGNDEEEIVERVKSLLTPRIRVIKGYSGKSVVYIGY